MKLVAGPGWLAQAGAGLAGVALIDGVCVLIGRKRRTRAARDAGAVEPRCERAASARPASQDFGVLVVLVVLATAHRELVWLGAALLPHAVRSRRPGAPAPDRRDGAGRGRISIYSRSP